MTDKFVSVIVDVSVTATALFAVLTAPAQHVAVDGSGMLQLAHAPDRISAVGDTFAIAMRDEAGHPYEVVNHVVAFEPDTHLAWMPARVDTPPVGVRWDWLLTPLPQGTRVTQTCDWSAVTSAEYLARRSLPRVSPEKMRETIERIVTLAG